MSEQLKPNEVKQPAATQEQQEGPSIDEQLDALEAALDNQELTAEQLQQKWRELVVLTLEDDEEELEDMAAEVNRARGQGSEVGADLFSCFDAEDVTKNLVLLHKGLIRGKRKY